MQGQLIWLVQNRDVIFPDVEVKKEIKLSFTAEQWTSTSMITFVADGGDTVPSRFEQLKPGSECAARSKIGI